MELYLPYAFHRKQLRRIVNVKYSIVTKSKEVHNKTNEKPISLEMRANGWRMFGHSLRMNIKSPTYKAMYNYFIKSDSQTFIAAVAQW